MTFLSVCLAVVACVLVLALYLKGDVKAMLKVPFLLTFSLEAKDKKRKTR